MKVLHAPPSIRATATERPAIRTIITMQLRGVASLARDLAFNNSCLYTAASTAAASRRTRHAAMVACRTAERESSFIYGRESLI